MLFMLLTHMSNFLPIRYIYYKNLQFKQLIDNIAIDFWSSKNFACMKDVKRKCNPMINLSKFTSNKKILSKVVALWYNQVCSQTLS